MANILFVCSANRFRSVIAAEYFRKLISERISDADFRIGSAGIWAIDGESPIRQAVQFAKSRQIDLDEVRSREINQQLIDEADLVVVMTQGQKEAINYEFPSSKQKIVLLSEICIEQTFDIPDPMQSSDDTPEVIGEEICNLVGNGFEKIITRARLSESRHE